MIISIKNKKKSIFIPYNLTRQEIGINKYCCSRVRYLNISYTNYTNCNCNINNLKKGLKLSVPFL